MLRGLFFQALGSIASLKSQTRDLQVKVPPGGLVLRIFTSLKIHRPQLDLNPQTLNLEASTLPRDHRCWHHQGLKEEMLAMFNTAKKWTRRLKKDCLSIEYLQAIGRIDAESCDLTGQFSINKRCETNKMCLEPRGLLLCSCPHSQGGSILQWRLQTTVIFNYTLKFFDLAIICSFIYSI